MDNSRIGLITLRLGWISSIEFWFQIDGQLKDGPCKAERLLEIDEQSESEHC